MEATLALRMKDMHLGQTQIALFFMIMPIFYAIVCIVGPYLFPSAPRKNLMIAAALLSLIDNFLVGPSKLLHLPDSVIIICIS